LEAGIHGLYCSVDGASKETFEKIRLGADFATVIGNIHRFIAIKNEMGLRHVQVGMKFVLQDSNRHETDAFLEYWISRVHNVAFQSMVARNNPWDSGGRVVETYYQADSRRRPCCAPFMGMSVAADGKVLPCVLTNFQKGEEIMGDLAVNSIEEIWHSDKYVKLRALHLSEKWQEISMCRQCDGILGDNAEIEVVYQDGGLVKIVTPGAITYKHQ
jgi:radical SAM protein with 4Fe4S-binding SPASM domain